MIDRLKQVPPWAWVAITAALGLAALTYHRFSQDDTDTDWHAVDQPPTAVALPVAPTSHVCRPMDVCTGFRQRTYPGHLVDADFSIIGEA